MMQSSGCMNPKDKCNLFLQLSHSGNLLRLNQVRASYSYSIHIAFTNTLTLEYSMWNAKCFDQDFFYDPILAFIKGVKGGRQEEALEAVEETAHTTESMSFFTATTYRLWNCLLLKGSSCPSSIQRYLKT